VSTIDVCSKAMTHRLHSDAGGQRRPIQASSDMKATTGGSAYMLSPCGALPSPCQQP
jgi:hypothetical protein